MYGVWLAVSRTVLLDTCVRKAGGMFRIVLRHRAWNPSRRRRSALFNQAEFREYTILLVMRA